LNGDNLAIKKYAVVLVVVALDPYDNKKRVSKKQVFVVNVDGKDIIIKKEVMCSTSSIILQS